MFSLVLTLAWIATAPRGLIHHAASTGDVARLEALLAEGVDPNQTLDDRGGVTPLMKAAEFGQGDAARVLLESGADVGKKTRSGYTALLFAAKQGHPRVIELLLSRGANVNHRAAFGRATPVLAAAASGCPECVRLLIAAGADVNATRENDRTPLLFAAASGDVGSVQLLLLAGATAEKTSKAGWTARELAKVYRQRDVFAALGGDVKEFDAEALPDVVPIGAVERPTLIKQNRPEYTRDALANGVAGDVMLEVVIQSDGRVGWVRIVDGLDVGLDLNAIECVRRWRFEPARRDGEPVAVIAEIAVSFGIN